jgi:pimeloyl-ACP methyl ester carboxylesterase
MASRKDAVVLLHCSGSSGAQWRALAAQLAARYEVVTPDLIGYGASAPWSGQGAFSLAQEAAALRDVFARFDAPAHLVGHSYGGGVALHIARTQPGLLKSLTLIEPTAFHLLRGGDAIDTAALREIRAVAAQVLVALASGDYRGGCGRFVDYWSGPGAWEAMPAEKRELFAPQLAKVALGFHALLNEPAGIGEMREISLPTLLVQGGCTTLAARCVCKRLRDALPEVFFRVVQSAGHMLPVTHRDAVNAAVAAHLDSMSTQGENHATRNEGRAVFAVAARGGLR